MKFFLFFLLFWVSLFQISFGSIENNRIAVIGGGLGGSVSAVYLNQMGVDIDIYEKNEEILLGSSRIPAHLYSGFMYADKGIDTVKDCFIDAIKFVRAFPSVINKRPTIVAISQNDERPPRLFEDAGMINLKVYEKLCEEDKNNQVFGQPSRFLKVFSREELIGVKNPWVQSFVAHTELSSLKFPVFLIQEYGLNMRKMVGILSKLLHDSSVNIHFKTEVVSIITFKNKKYLEINRKGEIEIIGPYNLIVDASGRSIANFENQVDRSSSRYTDVKFAGLFHMNSEFDELPIPEIYILGGQGKKFSGKDYMTHFSPLNSGICIINVTTNDCTYVNGGKVQAQRGYFNLSHQAQLVLNEDSQDMDDRLESMIRRISVRHPKLAKRLIPIRGLPGSVEVLGKHIGQRRSEFKVGDQDSRYISVNLSKGSASVRVAENLCEYLFDHQKKYGLSLSKAPKNHTWICEDLDFIKEIEKQRYIDDGIVDPQCQHQYGEVN